MKSAKSAANAVFNPVQTDTAIGTLITALEKKDGDLFFETLEPTAILPMPDGRSSTRNKEDELHSTNPRLSNEDILSEDFLNLLPALTAAATKQFNAFSARYFLQQLAGRVEENTKIGQHIAELSSGINAKLLEPIEPENLKSMNPVQAMQIFSYVAKGLYHPNEFGALPAPQDGRSERMNVAAWLERIHQSDYPDAKLYYKAITQMPAILMAIMDKQGSKKAFEFFESFFRPNSENGHNGLDFRHGYTSGGTYADVEDHAQHCIKDTLVPLISCLLSDNKKAQAKQVIDFAIEHLHTMHETVYAPLFETLNKDEHFEPIEKVMLFESLWQSMRRTMPYEDFSILARPLLSAFCENASIALKIIIALKKRLRFLK